METLAHGVAPAAKAAVALPIPAGTPSLPGAVFNPEEAFSQCRNSAAMVREMVQCFCDDMDRLLPQMRVALDEGDLEEVGRLGHRLKGTVSHLGAEPAKRAVLWVEQFYQCDGGTLTEAEKAVQALERECVLLKNALMDHPLVAGVDRGG